MDIMADGVDVILRLQNLQKFVAGTKQAAAGVSSIGNAAVKSNTQVRSSSEGMAGAAGLMRKAAKASAAGFIIAAAEGVKWSVQFQSQMELIHTQAGKSQKEVVKMTQAVLNMSGKTTAQGPQQLAMALYHLESLGLHGSQALKALQVSANGADVGLASIADTASGLGAIWFTQIKGAGDFEHVMGMLNATVGAGNMHFQDLIDSLGTGIVPAAKLAGLGLRDVLGAVATLADMKYNPSSAMAQLATALHFLTNPTIKATAALKELNLSKFELSRTMKEKGLPAALDLLRSRLSAQPGGIQGVKAGAILGDILPGGRGRVLAVLLQQLDRYRGKLGQIQGTTNTFAEKVTATHNTAAYKIRAAWARIQVAMIKFGNILQGTFVTVATIASFAIGIILKLVGWVLVLISGANKLPGPLKFIIKIVLLFAAAIAIIAGLIWVWGALVGGIYLVGSAIATVTTTLLANPIILILAALAVAAYLIITNWKKVGPFLASVWKAIKGAFNAGINFVVGIAKWFWQKVVWYFENITPLGIIITHLSQIGDFFASIFNGIVNFVKKLPGRIAHAAVGLWDGLKSGLKAAINWIIGALNLLIKGYNDTVGAVAGFFGINIKMGYISPLGGDSSKKVQPRSTGGGGASVPVHPREMPEHVTILKVNNREIARAAGKYTSDRNARH